MDDLFKLKNKICEIRSYIASNWPSIEERRRLYDELYKLEKIAKEIEANDTKDQPEKD